MKMVFTWKTKMLQKFWQKLLNLSVNFFLFLVHLKCNVDVKTWSALFDRGKPRTAGSLIQLVFEGVLDVNPINAL